jgi:hypothetical protein
MPVDVDKINIDFFTCHVVKKHAHFKKQKERQKMPEVRPANRTWTSGKKRDSWEYYSVIVVASVISVEVLVNFLADCLRCTV